MIENGQQCEIIYGGINFLYLVFIFCQHKNVSISCNSFSIFVVLLPSILVCSCTSRSIFFSDEILSLGRTRQKDNIQRNDDKQWQISQQHSATKHGTFVCWHSRQLQYETEEIENRYAFWKWKRHFNRSNRIFPLNSVCVSVCYSIFFFATLDCHSLSLFPEMGFLYCSSSSSTISQKYCISLIIIFVFVYLHFRGKETRWSSRYRVCESECVSR